jgi:hypothetical protein
MNRGLAKRLEAVERRIEPAGCQLNGIQIMHDPETDGPVPTDEQIEEIRRQEMERRIAAGEARPGDWFPIILHVIVHPMGVEHGHA